MVVSTHAAFDNMGSAWCLLVQDRLNHPISLHLPNGHVVGYIGSPFIKFWMSASESEGESGYGDGQKRSYCRSRDQKLTPSVLGGYFCIERGKKIKSTSSPIKRRTVLCCMACPTFMG